MWARLQSCLFRIFIYVVGLICLNLLFYSCGEFIIPIFRRSKADQACQEEGYWYGYQNKNGEITCESWYVTP